MKAKRTEEQERDNKLLVEAAKIAVNEKKMATSLLQRRLCLGYGRAAKIVDRLIELGYVMAFSAEGRGPCEVIVTAEQLQADIENGIVVMSTELEE